MPLRILTAIIVLFWMGTVGWLCAVVWAPPESRMSQIDPMEVYRVFFNWNDSANMTLLEHGMRRGQITMAGGSGEEAETGTVLRVLSVSGSIEKFDELTSSSLVDLFWKGTVEFSEAMAMQEGEFAVRIPRQELTAQLSVTGAAAGYQAKVLMGGREILSFDSAASEKSKSALATQLLVAGGMGAIPGLGNFNPAAIKFETEARMGNFNFAGRDMRAFLLKLRHPEQDQEIRIYLSEVGEPLKIETDLGFDAISEILVPLDAYRRESPPRPND